MGYLIKEIRLQQNMTQEELSEKSGVSRATIANLENGRAMTTTTKTLLAIARALDTTVDKIFFE